MSHPADHNPRTPIRQTAAVLRYRWRRRWQALTVRLRGIRNVAGAWRVLLWVGSRAVWMACRVLNKRRAVAWFVRVRCRPSARRAWTESASGPQSPPFPLRVCNPIHWRREARREVAALGPLDLLPPGVSADVAVRGRDPFRLRRYRHVVDVQGFHADVASRAGRLARLAAAGVVVHAVDAGDELRELLGSELHSLVATPPGGLDLAERELHSVGMRRAAMRFHSSWARDSGNLPHVSIVMATKRPWILPDALAAVARQSYPRTELVLALHGNDHALPAVEREVRRLPLPAKVVPVPNGVRLGKALQAASVAAEGTLLTKMDDDDLYGPDHVWDLVLAHRYSQAQLVGKGHQFVYLEASDQTLTCRDGRGESYRAYQCGGTLLIGRRDLQDVGGWRDLAREEDVALERDVIRAGGSVYRTHGAAFMLVRHGRHHTWRAADRHFLLDADKIVSGWAPEMAGLDSSPRPAVCRTSAPPDVSDAPSVVGASVGGDGVGGSEGGGGEAGAGEVGAERHHS